MPNGPLAATAIVMLSAAAAAASGQTIRGSVQTVTISGPITGQPVVFSLYLPEGYSAQSPRMPVIYHLHGIGGTHNGQQITSVPLSYETARAAGIIGPAVIIFPSGYTDSFWADSANSPKPAETNVLGEIMPHIESNFRVIADRRGRVMQGFSMGGFGAMKFASKRPDLFSVVVAYDAAMVTWPTMLSFHAQQAAEIFNSSETYYNQFSAWYWTGPNAAAIASDVAVRMVVGSLVGGNRNFRTHLQSRAIPVDYVETGLAHSLGPILDAQGQASWAFIAANLDLPPDCPADINGSGQLTVQDLFEFLAAFFAGEAAGNFNGVNGHTTQDIFDFLAAYFAGCP